MRGADVDSGELARLIEESLGDFADECPANYVPAEAALSPDLAGVRLYDRPLVRFGAADDPLFVEFLLPHVVGPQMRLPRDWLEGAQSVVSYFFPASECVRASNRIGESASLAWRHARIEGQAFILRAGEHLVGLLQQQGFQAVCPARDAGFQAVFAADDPKVAYRSNWSERHVAYLCGLGTFGLSKGLITQAGMAGRFGSVVTTAPLSPSVRPYAGVYDYCIMCGACAGSCPVGAISLQEGKDHVLCHKELEASKAVYPGYYGCGKCQVGVPCEHANPSR